MYPIRFLKMMYIVVFLDYYMAVTHWSVAYV